ILVTAKKGSAAYSIWHDVFGAGKPGKCKLSTKRANTPHEKSTYNCYPAPADGRRVRPNPGIGQRPISSNEGRKSLFLAGRHGLGAVPPFDPGGDRNAYCHATRAGLQRSAGRRAGRGRWHTDTQSVWRLAVEQ